MRAMRILRDHIVYEFMGPFLFSLSSFMFVLLLGRGLVQMADLIFNKDVDPFLIMKILWYSFPFILTFLIPMSVLVASLLTFGKLSFDNEIMAIRASGISLLRILQPLLFVTTILCLATFILSDQVASTSHYATRKLLAQVGFSSPAAALEEGTFIKKFKNFVIFIYELDKNELKGVRIYQPQEGKPTRVIIAEKGELISVPENKLLKLKLIHGTSDEPDPKDPSKLYKLNFKTYDLPLTAATLGQDEEIEKKPKDMSIRELKEEIRSLGQKGIRATWPLSAEIHHKIAVAFSSLAFLLIGVPLGITTRRAEKSISFAISLVLVSVYWLLLISGKSLAQKGFVPPFAALQFPNFLLGSLGLFLFLRMVKK